MYLLKWEKMLAKVTTAFTIHTDYSWVNTTEKRILPESKPTLLNRVKILVVRIAFLFPL